MPGNQMPPYALTPFIVSNTPRGILFFLKILFILERVSESTNWWEGQREREKQTLAEQEAPSGTRSQDPVVLTWAEGRWFTDWATQAPLPTSFLSSTNNMLTGSLCPSRCDWWWRCLVMAFSECYRGGGLASCQGELACLSPRNKYCFPGFFPIKFRWNSDSILCVGELNIIVKQSSFF